MTLKHAANARVLPVYVSDAWSHTHWSSRSHSYATATIADLISSLAHHGRLTSVELLEIFHHRRMLCRGCQGLSGYEKSPLADFASDEVIGFVKCHGVIGGNCYNDAKTAAEHVDKRNARLASLRRRAHELNVAMSLKKSMSLQITDVHVDAHAKVETEIRDTFDNQLLSGIVFDSEDVPHVKPLASQLKARGAIEYGNTGVVSSLSTPLPHPYHPAIQLAGSTGAGSLSVALGLSTFSLGTNGGGSSRMSAGLLGLSGVGVYHTGDEEVMRGGNPTIVKAPGVACVARTPLDNALIVNAAEDNPMPLTGLMEWFRRPLTADTSIGFLSQFAPEFEASEACFPGFRGVDVKAVPLHESVDDAFRAAVEGINAAGFRRSMIPCDGLIREISHAFFSHGSSTYLEAHKTKATQLKVKYLLTPLLRIPYWKKRSNDGNNTYNKDNTNGEFSSLPMVDVAKSPPDRAATAATKVLDPTCNPYCILADAWGTPSVTIPFSIKAPHLIHAGVYCRMPYGLLLTAVPQPTSPLKTAAPYPQGVKDLLFVAHKLHISLSGYTLPPVYMRKLSELEGRPGEHDRVEWPTDFESDVNF